MVARSFSPAGPASSSGRPRDRSIDDAVLNATTALLREEGYGALSVSAVAERAGTTTPAIYRRYAVLQEIVIAALARQIDVTAPADSGCTRCDLMGAVQVFTDAFQQSLPPRILAPLIADVAFDEKLYHHAMEALFLPLRTAARAVLNRAAERGDLRDDTDPEIVLDLLASMVHYRALYGHAPVTPGLIQNVVDTLLQGIAADYPALLAISQARGHGTKHPRTASINNPELRHGREFRWVHGASPDPRCSHPRPRRLGRVPRVPPGQPERVTHRIPDGPA